MTTKRTTDRSTVVDTATHWRPVGPDTPRGAKVQLINQAAGVATYGNWAPESWWTHWHPLPVFQCSPRDK